MTDAADSSVPIVEAVQVVANTVINPTVPVLAEDLLLVHQIASEIKAKLAGKHPTLVNILWSLI